MPQVKVLRACIQVERSGINSTDRTEREATSRLMDDCTEEMEGEFIRSTFHSTLAKREEAGEPVFHSEAIEIPDDMEQLLIRKKKFGTSKTPPKADFGCPFHGVSRIEQMIGLCPIFS